MKNGQELKKNLTEALSYFICEQIDWEGESDYMSHLHPEFINQAQENENNRQSILKELQEAGVSKELQYKVMNLESDTRYTTGNIAEVAYIQGFLEGLNGESAGLKNLICMLLNNQEEALFND